MDLILIILILLLLFGGGFGYRPGELEEIRRRDQAAADREWRPPERKLMMGAPLGRAGGKPKRNSANSSPIRGGGSRGHDPSSVPGLGLLSATSQGCGFG